MPKRLIIWDRGSAININVFYIYLVKVKSVTPHLARTTILLGRRKYFTTDIKTENTIILAAF
jgi:hypothetical protein